MKQEKQALRKSPERKIGQVLLAPYRLPQKLFREVRKRIRVRGARIGSGVDSAQRISGTGSSGIGSQPQELAAMRDGSRDVRLLSR